MKQPGNIWANSSTLKTGDTPTWKQRKSKPCAYFLAYTPCICCVCPHLLRIRLKETHYMSHWVGWSNLPARGLLIYANFVIPDLHTGETALQLISIYRFFFNIHNIVVTKSDFIALCLWCGGGGGGGWGGGIAMTYCCGVACEVSQQYIFISRTCAIYMTCVIHIWWYIICKREHFICPRNSKCLPVLLMQTSFIYRTLTGIIRFLCQPS